MYICSWNSLLKLKNDALLLGGIIFVFYFRVVSLVIFQIGCCKQIATKHTIPQNTEIFGFLGSKYQIITQLGHQDKNKACKVQKYLFKLKFLQKHMKNHRNWSSIKSLEGCRNQVLTTFFKTEK